MIIRLLSTRLIEPNFYILNTLNGWVHNYSCHLLIRLLKKKSKQNKATTCSKQETESCNLLFGLRKQGYSNQVNEGFTVPSS